jgi:enamine deaminase RidA (YjgF/YER057c/UK114 family)
MAEGNGGGTRAWRPIESAAPVGGIPYSESVLADDGTLYISGQIALDAAGVAIAGGIEAQTRHVLGAIRTLVELAGGSMADVLFVTTHLVDAADFDGFNSVYRDAFTPPYPARITTVAGALLADGVLIESSAVARISAARPAG